MLTPGFARDESDSTCIPPLQIYIRDLKAAYPETRISIVPIQYPNRGDQYQWHGLSVYPIHGRNRRFPLRLFAWNRVIQTFKQIHQAHPVDLVHSFWLNEATLLGQRIHKQFGVRLISTVMGQDPLKDNRYLGWIRPEVPTIVSISERAAAHLEQNTGRSADHIIPWGLDVPSSQQVPDVSQRPIDLLGVGSMVRVKRFEDFFSVLLKLKEAKSDVKAVLIGAGMTSKNLSGFAEGMNLEDNLELWGEKPRSEVLETMQRAKILLHPAIYEGQGYVFSEALAAGMSIVSRPVGSATASDRWKIGPNVDEMVTGCLRLLRNLPDPAPFSLYSMEETVNAYAKVYGL